MFKLPPRQTHTTPTQPSPDAPHPLADREPLQREVLRVLEHQVGDVEDRAEPVVLVRREVGRLLDSQNRGAAQGRLVHELDPVEHTHEGHEVPVDLAADAASLLGGDLDVLARDERGTRVDFIRDEGDVDVGPALLLVLGGQRALLEEVLCAHGSSREEDSGRRRRAEAALQTRWAP